MMQYLHCQRAMASWIPISRSNSFLKNVRHFTVGGNLLNFPWFLPWNPKESTQDVQHLNPQIWPCSSHCVYITIIFLTFLTHQKPKNHRVPFQVPQPPPQKNWASVFFFQSKKRRIWNITSPTLPRLHPAVPLCRYPWSQRWWSLQRCGRTWDPVRGEGGVGCGPGHVVLLLKKRLGRKCDFLRKWQLVFLKNAIILVCAWWFW